MYIHTHCNYISSTCTPPKTSTHTCTCTTSHIACTIYACTGLADTQYTQACMHTRTHTHTHAYTHAHTTHTHNTRTRKHAHTTHTHANTHTHTYTHTKNHTHTCKMYTYAGRDFRAFSRASKTARFFRLQTKQQWGTSHTTHVSIHIHSSSRHAGPL